MASSTENNSPSVKEEIANAITHGIGAVLAIAALVVLVVLSALHGTVWHIVSFSVANNKNDKYFYDWDYYF